MGSTGPGHFEDFQRRWLGPALPEHWRAAFAAVGVRAEDGALVDPDDRDALDPEAPVFRQGWVAGLAEPVALAVGRELARHGGRPITLVEVVVEASLGDATMDVETRSTQRTFGLDGTWSEPSRERTSSETYDTQSDYGTDGYVRDEVLRWTLAELTGFDEIVPPGARVPASVAAHPTMATRALVLDLQGFVARSDSPAATIEAAGGTIRLDGWKVDRVLAELEALGRLDPTGGPPDLSRWAERAARRAGLAAVPTPGDPGWDTFSATWSSLTASDRGRPGRAGQVATWRFRTPGEWVLPRVELAELARLAELRDLTGQDAAGIRVEPRAPFVPAAPVAWPSTLARVDGDDLVVTDEQGHVVVRARRTPEDHFERFEGVLDEETLHALWREPGT